MGKGSKPRPFSVDQSTFDSNWDKIFKKKEHPEESWDHYSDLPATSTYNEKEKKDGVGKSNQGGIT